MESKTIKIDMQKVLGALSALRGLEGYDDLDKSGGKVRRVFKFKSGLVSRKIVKTMKALSNKAEESDQVRKQLVKEHSPDGSEEIDEEKNPREFEAFKKAYIETLLQKEEVEIFPISFDDLDLEKNPIPVTIQEILEDIGFLTDEEEDKKPAAPAGAKGA